MYETVDEYRVYIVHSAINRNTAFVAVGSNSGILGMSFWEYKFNSDYIFTRLRTDRTCCPVSLRYNA